MHPSYALQNTNFQPNISQYSCRQTADFRYSKEASMKRLLAFQSKVSALVAVFLDRQVHAVQLENQGSLAFQALLANQVYQAPLQTRLARRNSINRHLRVVHAPKAHQELKVGLVSPEIQDRSVNTARKVRVC